MTWYHESICPYYECLEVSVNDKSEQDIAIGRRTSLFYLSIFATSLLWSSFWEFLEGCQSNTSQTFRNCILILGQPNIYLLSRFYGLRITIDNNDNNDIRKICLVVLLSLLIYGSSFLFSKSAIDFLEDSIAFFFLGCIISM